MFVTSVDEKGYLMGSIHSAGSAVTGLGARLYARLAVHGRDRGDVPGWVLVTIMTAGLVTALWLVADEKLRELFDNALDGVSGP